jgi:poly(3-hydroxybutyrate) depolymerase
MIRSLCVAILVLSALPAAVADKIVKETFAGDRPVYLFVPESSKATPGPLIILLHGSGRDGRILVEHWQSLAKKEGIVLVGPDANVRDGWSMSEDGPLLFRRLIEGLKTKVAFDPRRVYLFGHSAGAVHGLTMGVLESEYFAAVAAHAGVLSPAAFPIIGQARRKIPMAIWVGTDDRFFSIPQVRATRDALNAQGFNTDLTEISGHTHDYYGSSSAINKQAWEFLKSKRLDQDPQYQDYVIGR